MIRAMSPSRFAAALAALIIGASVTAAENLTLSPFARSPSVKRWIWYQVLGPRNHPFPIVYLSTEHFQTTPLEFLVVLPPATYDIVSAFTRARIARPDCPGKEPTGDVWYTVEIAEHHREQTQHCVLPQRLACEYLSGVVKLGGIDRTAKELGPIAGFMREIGCKAPSTAL